MYIECLALDLKIPISYGDSSKTISFFTNSRNEIKLTSSIKDQLPNANFIKDKSGINLVKIHGGLSKFLHKDNTVLLNQSLSKNNSSDIMNEFVLIQDLEYNSNPRGIGKDIFSLDHNKKIDVMTRSMLTGSNKYGVASKRKKGEEKIWLFEDVLKDIEELTVIGYGFNDLDTFLKNYFRHNFLVGACQQSF